MPQEIKEGEREMIERDRKHTEEERERNKLEKSKFADIAENFSCEELLVSEEEERPTVGPSFPTILIIPDRYPANLKLIQKFVPEERLEEAINRLCFHERLHSMGPSAKHQNNFGVKISKELVEQKGRAIEKRGELQEILDQIGKTVGDKELIRAIIDGQQLLKEGEKMIEKLNNHREKLEIITDRQLMKETSNVGALASLMLIDPMLSDGVVGARLVLNRVRKLKTEPIEEEAIIRYPHIRYPHAHRKTIEKLIKNYIKIGGEIMEKFDAWEKEK